MLSVTRGAAQPFGTVDPARPNISATRWSTVAGLTHRVYYCESTTSPNIAWVRLEGLDLSPGAPQLRAGRRTWRLPALPEAGDCGPG